MIDTLIDKQDNFEIIRDQIAGILVIEVASQMAKAADAGKEPKLWDLNVYTERSNPWERYLNGTDDQSPIVNVWYDNSSFDPSGSNVSQRQKTVGIFNVDCYGYGVSKDDPDGGHILGDQEAAFEAQRALRLVRNILMASNYTYLDLRGMVWGRWPQTAQAFQPQIDARNVQQIVAARFALKVTFNEFSPQYTPETLEYVAIDIKRNDDGLVVLEADYDYS